MPHPKSLQRHCQNHKDKNKFSNFSRRQKDDKNPNFSRRPLATSDSCLCLFSLEGFTFHGVVMLFAQLQSLESLTFHKKATPSSQLLSQSCKDMFQVSSGRRHKLHTCTPPYVTQVTLLQKDPQTFKFAEHCTCLRQKVNKWYKIILLSASSTFPWQIESQYQS